MKTFEEEHAEELKDSKKYEELFEYCSSFPEDGLAIAYLASCYYYGYGTEEDDAKAVELYEQAAGQGNDLALLRLGNLYYKGIGTKKDLKKAFELYSKAKEYGFVQAYYRLAACYKDGAGTEQDYEKALENFEVCIDYPNAFDSGELAEIWVWTAECHEELKNETEAESAYNQAIEIYSKLTDGSDGEAEYHLGKIREKGCPNVRDKKLAFQFYEEASMKGYGGATLRLAKCYEKGIGVEKNEKKAFQLMKKLADKFPLVEVWLAAYYDYGIGTEENIARAINIYNKYTDDRDEDISGYARFGMGVCYFHGKGVACDKGKALELFQGSNYGLADIYARAITDAQPSDFYALSLMYKCNMWENIRPDAKRSFEFCLSAYEKSGRTAYQKELAEMYFWGRGTKKDLKKALELFKEAGEAQNEQYIGEFYYYGSNVPRDYSLAVQLFYKGITENNSHSAVYLGLCYLNGYGVEKNMDKALSWFEKAAEMEGACAAFGLVLGAFVILGNENRYYEKSKDAAAMLQKAAKQNNFLQFIYDMYTKFETDTYARFLMECIQKKWEMHYKKRKPYWYFIKYFLVNVREILKKEKKGSIKTLRADIIRLREELLKTQTENSQKDNVIEEKERYISELSKEVEYYRDTLSHDVKNMSHDVQNMGHDVQNIGSDVQEINMRTQRMQEQLLQLTAFVKSELPDMIKESRIEFRRLIKEKTDEDDRDIIISDFISAVSAHIDNSIRTSSASTLVENERDYLKSLFGSGWNKLLADSQISLISAGVLWKSCSDIADVDFDYSGICISATSALESELKRYFFVGFQDFMLKKYGKPDSGNWEKTFSVWPEELLAVTEWEFRSSLNKYENNPAKNRKPGIDLKDSKSVTLGKIPYLFGVKKPAHQTKKQSQLLLSRLNEYLSAIVNVSYEEKPIDIFIKPGKKGSFITRCDEVRKKYRNPSAHTDVIARDDARHCYQEVIGRIAAYDYSTDITSLLLELVQVVK